ncbi:CD320 antigen [Tenrec ecaudatus]|uniref:CD320 antigen n=1 Tax=Tenrec ecaudatus TaxID=94439 RepID=UPI003F599695
MARAGAQRTAAVGLALRLLLGLGLRLEAAATPTGTPIPIPASASSLAPDPSAVSCPPTNFQCRTSGVCLPIAWRCDSDRDCLDGSDEDECRIEPPGIEPCAQDGQCPPPTGCPGGQGKNSPNCGPRPCPAGEVPCAQGGDCIPRTWRCDGHPDCPDYSDERGCGTTETVLGGHASTTMTPMIPEGVTYFSDPEDEGQDEDQAEGQSENQSAMGVIAAAAVLSAALAAAALLALCQLIGPVRHLKETLLMSESKAFLL